MAAAVDGEPAAAPGSRRRRPVGAFGLVCLGICLGFAAASPAEDATLPAAASEAAPARPAYLLASSRVPHLQGWQNKI